MSFDRLAGLALILGLTACGHGVTTSEVDRAIMPQVAGVPVLSPEGAVSYAAYTLGHRSTTVGQPANAALALAAVDYLAGDFYTDFHWFAVPGQDKVMMMLGRGEMRTALGIAPFATSQQVVNGLVAASVAYRANDPVAVAAALPPNVFTLGPDGTTRVLSNLPPLVNANTSAQAVEGFLNFGCINGGTAFGCS